MVNVICDVSWIYDNWATNNYVIKITILRLLQKKKTTTGNPEHGVLRFDISISREIGVEVCIFQLKNNNKNIASNL